MQGGNYTQSLKDQGLRTPSELIKLWDVNPMGGGRIIRDRLWFYLQYRENRSENTVPGMWFNRNAGDPAAWTVDFDRSRQAFKDTLDRTASARITWQISKRNKLSVYWNEQYNTIGATRGRHRDADDRSDGAEHLQAFANPAGHLVVAVDKPRSCWKLGSGLCGPVDRERWRRHPNRRHQSPRPPDDSDHRAGRRDPWS